MFVCLSTRALLSPGAFGPLRDGARPKGVVANGFIDWLVVGAPSNCFVSAPIVGSWIVETLTQIPFVMKRGGFDGMRWRLWACGRSVFPATGRLKGFKVDEDGL